MRDVDWRCRHSVRQERQRPARSLIARMSLDIRIGCGVGVWHQGQARLCEADGANLVMDAKIDWPDGGRVARAPERQVTPFILLNRPDRAVLVKPIRVRLIGERNPGRKNAVFASLIARLMDSG